MLHLDFETFCHIDVREVGAAAYSRHPSCEVLMMSWAFDDDSVQLWEPDGPWDYDSMPREVYNYLVGAVGPVCAHNVEFELNIFRHVLGIELPLRTLRDTSALALVNGYPKSLAGAGAALGLPVQKDTRGSALIKKFCQLNRGKRTYSFNAKEDWAVFGSYCVNDTVVEREIWRTLCKK